MKKTVFTLLLAFSTSVIFAQKYHFKKIISTNELGTTPIKMEGNFIFKDSVIHLYQNGTATQLDVFLQSNTPAQKIFKLKHLENTDTEVRITLSLVQAKKEIGTVIFETKDNFNHKMMTLVYLLYKKED